MKNQKIREKIEDMIEDLASRKRWAYYKILELTVFLSDDGNFLSADVTINYRDESGIDEQLISKFNKLTKKDFNENIRIY
jgi:hypothetical protein